MNILDSMKDIVKHTSGLGVLDMVKIVGEKDAARVESIDTDKTVVLFGEMYGPIADLDTTIGLSRLQILRGYMDLHNGSTVSVVKEHRNTQMFQWN